MKVRAVTVRSFRNLTDATLELPEEGLALLGPNGHGKTNLLEALAYPVLFRSLRSARDRDIARFGGSGFHVTVQRSDGLEIATTFVGGAGGKKISVGGEEKGRVTDALGAWLAVTFMPTDLSLVQGGAAERRRWLDRMLSLGSPAYLEALLRYRAAVAQRNAALKRDDLRSAGAFDVALADNGALVVATRLKWLARWSDRWTEESALLGEVLPAEIRYRGEAELAESGAWAERLEANAERDRLRGQTHVGPHRHELVLELDGRSLREFGSTGQQRTAAIGLRLLEHGTLAEDRSTKPALLVDDIFAELDQGRQRRLADRLAGIGAQVVVTAPRQEDIPEALEAPRWHVDAGTIEQG